METLEIVLAHKQRSFLSQLEGSLNNKEFTVTQSTNKGIAALRGILRTKPDVAILDYSFKDISAFDIVKEANKKKSETKFFVIYPEATYNDSLLSKSLKISGNVNHTNSLENIVAAINKVSRGETVNCAFEKLKAADDHLLYIHTLDASQLEFCTLLGVYANLAKVGKKLDLNNEDLNDKKDNIINCLQFDNVNRLIEWCIANLSLIQKLAVKIK